MKNFEKILGSIVRVSAIFGGILLLILMLLIAVDVVMRLFRSPIVGLVEISVYTVVCVVYLGIPWCAWNNSHVRVDIIKKWKWLDHATNILLLVTLFYIAVQCAAQSAKAYEMGIATVMLHVPRWPFLGITGYGFILSAIVLIYQECLLIGTSLRRASESRGGVSIEERGDCHES
ncbi:MAG: TRAP transporter small permease [Clostridiales Family XIII bacterium]|jgi:TRAP-type C4-dicarboxylate transport system permease small subunit|nr:TRAP transporter small permease [Clostridiales Family XIII bacterium]